jgi:hypothetical protein
MTTLDLERDWDRATPFHDYVAAAQKNQDLWNGVYRLARVPDDIVQRARALPGSWKLLVLSEDWCGDAVNTIPVLQKLTELSPNLEIRLLSRDENPELMGAHLSPTGARAIPVVMVLDEAFHEHGWWGSRPGPLQQWVLADGLAMPKDERYLRVRAWYARDRGRTTLDEVLSIAECAVGIAPEERCAELMVGSAG